MLNVCAFSISTRVLELRHRVCSNTGASLNSDIPICHEIIVICHELKDSLASSIADEKRFCFVFISK